MSAEDHLKMLIGNMATKIALLEAELDQLRAELAKRDAATSS